MQGWGRLLWGEHGLGGGLRRRSARSGRSHESHGRSGRSGDGGGLRSRMRGVEVWWWRKERVGCVVGRLVWALR